jgi:hypothetical protein
MWLEERPAWSTNRKSAVEVPVQEPLTSRKKVVQLESELEQLTSQKWVEQQEPEQLASRKLLEAVELVLKTILTMQTARLGQTVELESLTSRKWAEKPMEEQVRYASLWSAEKPVEGQVQMTSRTSALELGVGQVQMTSRTSAVELVLGLVPMTSRMPAVELVAELVQMTSRMSAVELAVRLVQMTTRSNWMKVKVLERNGSKSSVLAKTNRFELVARLSMVVCVVELVAWVTEELEEEDVGLASELLEVPEPCDASDDCKV